MHPYRDAPLPCVYCSVGRRPRLLALDECVAASTVVSDNASQLAVAVEDDPVCARRAASVWIAVEASQEGELLVGARHGEVEALVVVVGVRIRVDRVVVLVALASSTHCPVHGRSIVADVVATGGSTALPHLQRRERSRAAGVKLGGQSERDGRKKHGEEELHLDGWRTERLGLRGLRRVGLYGYGRPEQW